MHRGDELELEIVVGHREQRGDVHVQLLFHGLGFRVQGLGFGVWGLGFRVLGFGVWSSRFWVLG